MVVERFGQTGNVILLVHLESQLLIPPEECADAAEMADSIRDYRFQETGDVLEDDSQKIHGNG